MIVFGAAGAVTQQPSGLQIRPHSGNQRSDHSHLAHGLVADLSFGRVGDAFFKAASQKPQRRTGRADSAVVQTDRAT